MIRLAVPADFAAMPTDDEAMVRIGALYDVYGADTGFLRLYTDGEEGFCSVMDGVGIYASSQPITEEWIQFIGLNPDIRVLHTSFEAGQTAAAALGRRIRSGKVMAYVGSQPAVMPAGINTAPSLPAVHQLLERCFPDFTPLDSWYPDVSHRLRHGHGHIAAITKQDTVVSSALTVAEYENSAILGQVATAPEKRRQGLAGQCIRALIFALKGKRLYILPANDGAEKLYTELGFRPSGAWAEVNRL